MYPSRQARTRNFASPGPYDQPRGSRRVPPILIIAVIAIVLLLCCCCVVIAASLFFYTTSSSSADSTGGFKLPSLFGPSPTPTVDKNAAVPLKTPALSDVGLELTVQEVTNPLKTAPEVKVPANEKYIAVTIRIRNRDTKATIEVKPSDFTVKGFGGLEYQANPKEVVMDDLFKTVSIAPGKDVRGTLIFRVAANDGELKLYWKTAKGTRNFSLEPTK